MDLLVTHCPLPCSQKAFRAKELKNWEDYGIVRQSVLYMKNIKGKTRVHRYHQLEPFSSIWDGCKTVFTVYLIPFAILPSLRLKENPIVMRCSQCTKIVQKIRQKNALSNQLNRVWAFGCICELLLQQKSALDKQIGNKEWAEKYSFPLFLLSQDGPPQCR